jgi:multicomponent Na+:H+ antiporter subunit G
MLSDLLEKACLTIGIAFCILAGIGVVRMPDVYCRNQASAKAGTLGVAFVIAAVAFRFGDAITSLEAFLIIAFLFLTAPVASHLITRAAYVLGNEQTDRATQDDMKDRPDAPATDADGAEHRD